ncbi:bacteriorhodopsin-like [Aquiluna sp.]|jgi:bacteriorhodopsin|nr:bacteriorhodopsin-like [Aquiluna sp.]MDA8552022.1 bacteriorhodopsin-like [Aquiluna sp.]MDA8718871.1 bacteriorhodopsin-like [Aquiluna sp.]MDA8796008.1 bacteriorhodopsin-like [Aquiluna sp.]
MSAEGYNVVFNMLSLGIASMLFTTTFLLVARERVLPRYRMAVMVSATVTAIAAYHYFRMFDSFVHAFGPDAVAGASYNVGYRYVDWFLTVPLLLVETVAVLALARQAQSSLLVRLVPAAALMIALGYPGDSGMTMGLAPSVWGLLSTIPFLYILYVLFVELGKSLERQSEAVQRKIKELRLLLLATWGVYPIAFIANMNATGFDETSFVLRETGYTIADILAKCLFGLMIFTIARIKSGEEDKEFAKAEFKD